MTTSENFQALKQPHFAWLESPEQERARLLAKLASSLEPKLFEALQSLIEHTQITPSIGADSPKLAERMGVLHGPFRISIRIRGGGMGEVYLADRIKGGLNQQVALKLVRRIYLAGFTPTL